MLAIIGGAGYIGSHICKLLREQGVAHVVFDNLEKGHREAIPGSDLVLGDIRNREDLENLFATHKITGVMNFAAYIEVGEGQSQPSEFYWNNTVGMLNVLDAMRAHGVGCLVFSSTAATYGEPQYVPIDEKHPQLPTNTYGATKLAVERILSDYETAYGIRNVCLRYFNAAGSDPDGVLGEDHTPESHLIPRAILSALGSVPPLKIFGTDYDTPDGTCLRDYVHVMDLAAAHLLAMNHLLAGGGSRRYNLGNGTGFSVREVVETVDRVVGRPVPREDSPRRAGDPARLVASSEAIRMELGWTPQFPDLEAIVQHAWNWRKTHPNGY